MGRMRTSRVGTPDFHKLPMVYIDLETTGDSFKTGGEICEAGLVKVEPRELVILDELELKFRVNNPRERTEAELSYHGYNGFNFAEWADATEPLAALQQLLKFTAGCAPWAYNVGFEYDWLQDYCEYYEQDWLGDYHWHCLMSIASEYLRKDFQAGRIKQMSLSACGAFLGLGEEEKPHRGPTGARYERQLHRALRERFQVVPR